MVHAVTEKQKLLNRIRRLRGQIEAIERALDTDAGCTQVMQLLTAARGAITGLMAEVVEDHIRTHLVDPEKNPGALNADAADQLIEVVHTYLK
jgi:DNA-binding FrmR family transcriptional regulator